MLWQLGDAIAELSRLLSQAIVLPGARRHREGRGEAAGPTAPGAARVKDTQASPEAGRGQLVLIGGTRLGDDIVLEMIRLAGGRSARILIVPTAQLDFTRGGERYARSFRRFGAQRVETADIVTRRRAEDRALAAQLAEADLVFLGGGDVGLLLDLLRGTEALSALRAAHARGAVLAGIAGGASVLGEAVARNGSSDGQGVPHLEPALRLLPGLLVDAQAGGGARLGALLQALATGAAPPEGGPPAALLAIEEDAAVVLGPDQIATVVGTGSALVAIQDQAAGGAGALPRLALHVLPPGHRFDLRRRQALPPAAGDAAARQAR